MRKRKGTYSEIYAEVFGDGPIHKEGLQPEEQAAWNIIRMLCGRAGFDHWWSRVGEEDKDEIFEQIKDRVREEGGYDL